jgi:hypothetical protein
VPGLVLRVSAKGRKTWVAQYYAKSVNADGERVKGNRLWEQIIAEDFAEFRKAGLTSPMMADIEKELGISR